MDESDFVLEKETKQNVENQDGNYDDIYQWLEKIPFSKSPKTLARDFSDGVLMAELLKSYYPRLLEIHNCIQTNNVSMKKDNWNTLNRKVFSKINLKLNSNTISQLANCRHGTIEKLLFSLLEKITNNSINSSQAPVQENEDDNNESAIEEIKEPIELSEIEVSELHENDNKKLSSVLKTAKNILNFFIHLFMQIVCFWKWFNNWQIIKENLQVENKYNCGNNYLYDTASEIAYIEEEFDDPATRWAYEQLIQEIRGKEDIISTLNHKIAYLEGTMRLKDLQIANLMIQVTNNNSLEFPSNLNQRFSTSGVIRSRPRTHNSQLANSYFN